VRERIAQPDVVAIALDRAAEQGIGEQDAIKKGLEEKSKEFVKQGAELYAKA